MLKVPEILSAFWYRETDPLLRLGVLCFLPHITHPLSGTNRKVKHSAFP